MSHYNKKHKGVPHDSGMSHVTGESVFIDDRPELAGELHLGLVLSTVAHGKVKSLDISKAEALDGVVCFLTGDDFVDNTWGPIIKDQPLLASQLVSHYSEPVAIVVAKSRSIANSAKKLVEVVFEELNPVFTVDDAISTKPFSLKSLKLKKGILKKPLVNLIIS